MKFPENKGFANSTGEVDLKNLNIKISNLYEIKTHSYIVQSNVKVNKTERHFLYYLDLSQPNASYVTEGLYQNLETKDPGNGQIERQIFVLEKFR